MTDDLGDFFDICQWSIEHRRTFFANDGAKLVQLIAAQLGAYVVPTLVCRLKSVERVDDEAIKCELVLGSMERFFRLASLILSELTQTEASMLHDQVVLALRQLVAAISQSLLVDCLPAHLNRLSEQLFLVNAEQDHEDERLDECLMLLRSATTTSSNNNDDDKHIRNILSFKTSLCTLLGAVDKFEAQLRTANEFFKEHNDICLVDPSLHKRIDTQKLVKIGFQLSLIHIPSQLDPHSSPTTLATEAAAAEAAASSIRPSILLNERQLASVMHSVA